MTVVARFLEHKYPGDADALSDLTLRTGALAIISLSVGLIVTLIGLLRLGFLLDFVSVPVLKGFTAAACSITILSVFKDVLGYVFLLPFHAARTIPLEQLQFLILMCCDCRIHIEKSQFLHVLIENLHNAVQEHGVSTNAIITGCVSLAFLFLCKLLTKLHIFKCKRRRAPKPTHIQPVGREGIEDIGTTTPVHDTAIVQVNESGARRRRTRESKVGPPLPKTEPQSDPEPLKKRKASGCRCTLKQFEDGFAKFPAPLLLIVVACIWFYVLCPVDPLVRICLVCS